MQGKGGLGQACEELDLLRCLCANRRSERIPEPMASQVPGRSRGKQIDSRNLGIRDCEHSDSYVTHLCKCQPSRRMLRGVGCPADLPSKGGLEPLNPIP